MPKIKEVDDVIATRDLEYISSEGNREEAKVEVGRPFQTEEGDYVCPYRVGSSSYEHISRTVGIDSFQALQLSIKTMEAELIYWVRKRVGSFDFFR